MIHFNFKLSHLAIRCILFILFCSFSIKKSYSLQSINVHDRQDEYTVDNQNLEYLEDPQQKLTLTDWLSGKYDTLFRQFSGMQVVTKQGAAYWGRLQVNNNSTGTSWLLEFMDFRIDHLEVYIYDGVSYKKYTSGDDLPFYFKLINHKNFIYPLAGVKNQTYPIYYRVIITQQKPFVLYAKIRSYPNFISFALKEYFLLALFYGIIICMVLYNLFLFLHTKEKVHIIYCFYIASLAVFSLSRIDGIGFQYLWPLLPGLNAFVSVLMQSCFIIGAIVFSMYFLGTAKSNLFFHRLLIASIGIRILTGIASLFLFPDDELFRMLDLLFLSVIIVPAYNSFRKRELVTRHYFISFLFTYIGFLVYTLRDLGMIPYSALSYYGLNIGIIGEVIFLSLAITEKSRWLIIENHKEQQEKIKHFNENEKLKNKLIKELQEKEKLVDKVNRELESKVSERTAELKEKTLQLEELNLKLEAQSKEITRMASLLDIENWELKKELKKETQARVINQFVSYEEFCKIYPDEQSCLRYISELKWRTGFECKKCSGIKYSLNKKDLNRKCTKCTHIESVTSSTVFHGVRFSLNKALYIAYFTTHSSKRSNLTELADELDLRVETCRRFYQTVKEKKETRKEGLGDVNSIEKIIL